MSASVPGIHQVQHHLGQGIPVNLRSYIRSRNQQKYHKACQMYGQVCRNKTVKNLLSSLCRQDIVCSPERKCQKINPDKFRNQRHRPVKARGEIIMVSGCCQCVSPPVNNAVYRQYGQKRQYCPYGKIFFL